jgi:FMN phosphatase YigB (HAD superfamily)
MKKRFILFDIDNTLYNTSALREKLFARIFEVLQEHDLRGFEQMCQEIYHDVVARTGIFYPEDLVRELKKALPDKTIPKEKLLDAMYDPKLLTPHVYEEAHKLVTEFEKLGELGIFSQGMERFQQIKIQHIAQYFKQHHTHIVTSKLKALPHVFEKYKDFEVTFLDDALPILHEVKKVYPEVFSIWVKRGRHATKQEPIPGFTPDATVLNLQEAERILKKK